ncbi:hypothetical protein VHEMI03921 [[Torrubiella] hemipterigena]|uniref:DUF8004 domain-containing protein n=1 Tax=[Torrubiella] hemipterigena TaxID=1531966 RepID=A0A0A1TET8_9HYPO|nr:hypothetical protein VHEMI03921 [[Torrubiella] hemipterigena]
MLPNMASNPYLIQRKPLAIEKSLPANTPPPPPPPYNEHEPKISLDSKIEDPESFSPLTDSTAPSENSPSLSLPLLQTKIPGASFWDDDTTSPTSHPLPSLPAELPAAVPVEMPVNFDIEENPESTQLDVSRHGSTDSGSDTSFAGRRKLRKDSPGSRRRSNSYQSSTVPPPPQLGIKSRATATIPEPRGRSVSSHPTVAVTDMSPISIPVPPIPMARASSAQPANQSPSRGRVRRSWMPGSRSRSNSVEVSQALGSTSSSQAWIMGEENKSDYNTSFLKNAEKVPELWNESGSVLVFLFPKSTGAAPSFKVPEFTIASSYLFNELIASEQEALAASPSPITPSRHRARSFGGRDSLSVEDASRMLSPPMNQIQADFAADLRLYIPIVRPTATTGHLASPSYGAEADMERLIGIRNMFAFLTGQPLVGTPSCPNMFTAFLQIAELLEEFGFIGVDGCGFGQAVDMSFSFYCDQFGFSDCRSSREKTVEALILGERMRCMDLYGEAFAHAAGKYSAIMDLRLPLYDRLSPRTRQRLERSHIDLLNRQHNVNEHLELFEFPSIFAGIANSTSVPELRQIRFKVWKASFSKMRAFILSYYKGTFGSWPPKATSKKNPFAESGLNRLVLKLLYSDMCALYDLMVDRENITTRIIDHAPTVTKANEKVHISALRNIMSEFDRSRPPVLPPIPFDVPQLPNMAAIMETYSGLQPKEQAKFDKKIKEHELALILNKAYNYDTNKIKLPFLDQFKEFELREAKGKAGQDLVDQRIGYWLFLYAVLQSLPMLVVDAPGLKHTEGTEYFLCQPIMGQPPWAEDGQVRKMWYEVAGGGGLVELSADAVMYSVEATYHRSHCWLAAKQWENMEEATEDIPVAPALSPLAPPRPMFESMNDALGSGTPPASASSTPPGVAPALALRTRNLSPARNSRASPSWRSSIAIGIEPVPMDEPTTFGPHQRSSSMGPKQMSIHSGRSQSSGNLYSMAASVASSPRTMTPAPTLTSSATFDDILGTVSGNKEKKEKLAVTKKRSRFF